MGIGFGVGEERGIGQGFLCGVEGGQGVVVAVECTRRWGEHGGVASGRHSEGDKSSRGR